MLAIEKRLLEFLADWDEAHGEQWSDIRGPVITKVLQGRFGPIVTLHLGVFVKRGWVERLSRQELRTRIDSWRDDSIGQPWSQPWRITATGRAKLLH